MVSERERETEQVNEKKFLILSCALWIGNRSLLCCFTLGVPFGLSPFNISVTTQHPKYHTEKIGNGPRAPTQS